MKHFLISWSSTGEDDDRQAGDILLWTFPGFSGEGKYFKTRENMHSFYVVGPFTEVGQFPPGR